jgi:hypothetical protein
VEDKKTHLPIRIDDGVSGPKISREWLENIIRSHITPLIDGLTIVPIPLPNGNSMFVVDIPKSYRAPHQELDTKKYYKRFNFSSHAMEDYEINDIRARRRVVSPLLNVDVEIKDGAAIFLKVSNIGDLPAQDVKFDFSETLVWPSDKFTLPLFSNGAKYFPPGKTFKFFYHTFQEVMKQGSTIPSTFDVMVSYLHPDPGQRVTDQFHIDLEDYHRSSVDRSELYELGQVLKEVLNQSTPSSGN